MAMRFDGIDDYISINNPFYTFSNEISFSGWFFYESYPGFGAGIGQSTPLSTSEEETMWHFHPYPNGEFKFYIVNADNFINTPNYNFELNQWFHVTYVVSPEETKVFMNGEELYCENTETYQFNNNPNSAIHIGKDPRYPQGRWMKGLVDDIRVYNRSLSCSEVDSLYREVFVACQNFELQLSADSISVCLEPDSIKLTWTSDNGPFLIEKKIEDGLWEQVDTTSYSEFWVNVSQVGEAEPMVFYYRILDYSGCNTNVDSLVVTCNNYCSELIFSVSLEGENGALLSSQERILETPYLLHLSDYILGTQSENRIIDLSNLHDVDYPENITHIKLRARSGNNSSLGNGSISVNNVELISSSAKQNNIDTLYLPITSPILNATFIAGHYNVLTLHLLGFKNGNQSIYCEGESTSVEVNVKSNLSNSINYNWSHLEGENNTSDITIIINESSTYTLIVTDENGCTASSQLEVLVSEAPTFDLNIDTIYSCLSQDSSRLTWISSNGPFIIQQKIDEGEWTRVHTTSNSEYWAKINPVNEDESSTYYFRIIDNNGCESQIDSVVVTCSDICAEDNFEVQIARSLDQDGDGYTNDGSGLGSDEDDYNFCIPNPSSTHFSFGGGDCRGIKVVDMDGDEDQDVIAAYFNNRKLAWFENDGNESFTQHVISKSIGSHHDVEADDIDNDGDIDIFVPDYYNRSSAILINNGDNTYHNENSSERSWNEPLWCCRNC